MASNRHLGRIVALQALYELELRRQGLELMTLSAYALVALRRDNATATEAAMKYFVLGALASGFLLYGLSMLYGATSTLDIGGVRQAIEAGAAQKQVLVFGLVFVVAGLAFKFGVAPFHM